MASYQVVIAGAIGSGLRVAFIIERYQGGHKTLHQALLRYIIHSFLVVRYSNNIYPAAAAYYCNLLLCRSIKRQ